ncbi:MULTISPECIES: hypothetical protein [Burkholderia]|uniref:hypothetical protein n=1 Tax=Burkholderia TaxID=32008 RepID=UPI00163E5573|nr:MULTISPECIES: hypothetical protein [Burkholderia]UVS96973.1 hypothetical protein EFP19_15275 [Burkholderia glumae]
MAIKCNKPDQLIAFVRANYQTAKIGHPTELQTKIDFDCGLVMNVFNTGTVNFQGNSHENATKDNLSKYIETLNATPA